MSSQGDPDLSVVIPVDGRFEYLERCLQTILRQQSLRRGLSAEIIVVDTARAETLRLSTREVCTRSVRLIPSAAIIKYVSSPHPDQNHCNAGYARNVGIRLARASVVLMSDADVLHVSETLSQHVTLHQRHGGLLLYSFCRDCPADLPLENKVLERALTDERYELRMASHTNWFGSQCVSAKTDQVLHVGGFEESFRSWGYEDYDLARRLVYTGSTVVRDDAITTLHQVHPPSRKGAWLMKAKAGIRQMFRNRSANKGRKWGTPTGVAEVFRSEE